MARTSDTRARTREVAEQLLGAGEKPGSTKIRAILGGGSFSTIKDELKLWEAERSALQTAGRLGFGEPNQSTGLSAVVEPSPPLPPAAPGVAVTELAAALTAATEPLVAAIEKLQQELDGVRAELEKTRTSNAEQLALAYQRYEAVQKHAMTQIDDARRAAGELRQRLTLVTSDVEAREDAMRNKMQLIRDENVRLKAKVEVLQGLVPAAVS